MIIKVVRPESRVGDVFYLIEKRLRSALAAKDGSSYPTMFMKTRGVNLNSSNARRPVMFISS